MWLNAAAVRVLSRPVQPGDVIDVIPGDEPIAAGRPPAATIEIVHEDGWLVAVNKPAGLASQPPRQRRAHELTVPELLGVQLAWRDGRRAELLLFHRLDRITTGLLLLARHHEAARALTRVWREDAVEKTYLAVVRGSPGPGALALARPIARDRLTPGRFRTDRTGKPARTEIRELSSAGGIALVQARPHTGRTHQVRVHLAEAGFPVVGDHVYGGGGGAPRPFLHAWRLALPHPRDGSPLRLEAPLPPDMSDFVAQHALAVRESPPS